MDGRIGINDRIVAVNCVNLTRATRQEVRGILYILYIPIIIACLQAVEPQRTPQGTLMRQKNKGNVILSLCATVEENERINHTFWCI